MSDVLKLSSTCNRSGAPILDQPQLIYVLVELVPGEAIIDTRLPLNFCLLLDQSGSMAGEKIRTMKAAVKSLIGELNPDDVVSVVAFESKTRVLIPAQPANDKAEMKRQVDRLRDAGGTNMAGGLREALRQISDWKRDDRVSRIVLLTDGEATDRPDDSRALADEAGNRGVPIIALGFGHDWNEDFLFDLADRSVLADPGTRRGSAEYIPTPEEINKVFQQVYASMQVVALDVTLTVRMVQGLEARRVWQVTPAIRDLGRGVIQGRAMVIPVGQLEKGGAAFLAEIMLPPRPVGPVRILQSEVVFTPPNGEPQRQSADLILEFSDDPTVYNPLNGHVMNIVEKVQAFKLQTQALEDARGGDVRNATRKLRQAVTILLAQGENDLAGQMEAEANHLEQSGEISSEGKKTIMLTSRKTIRLSD